MMRFVLALVSALLLATPADAQFPQQISWAGTGAGTANAQTVTVGNAVALGDLIGVPVRFIAGATNTGATTLTVTNAGAVSLAATAIRKSTPSGFAALSGGEIVSGQTVTVVYDGTFFQLQLVQQAFAPTRQVFLVTGGQYTTPTGVRAILIRMIGAGGGGAGSGATAPSGSVGANTAFGSFTAIGGNGSTGGNGGTGGTGGSGSASVRLPGSAGSPQVYAALLGPGTGGNGGPGIFGAGAGRSAAPGPTVGSAGGANTGAGGGGASAATTTQQAGGGGGAGEYVEVLISPPTTSYAFTVGTGGGGGAAGGSGAAGGAGGAGIIIVDEYY